MGCDKSRLPSFFKNRSGLAQISHLSSTRYNAEKGFGESLLNCVYTSSGLIVELLAKNSWQKFIS